jgi:Leucine-rich repeat (LRR) protein
VSDNRIRIEQLVNLNALGELNVQFNQMDSLLLRTEHLINLETLNIAYNNIPANHINNLRHLNKLKFLDMASNDLITLPEDLSFLTQLEDLNISSNLFSSNSTLIKP